MLDLTVELDRIFKFERNVSPVYQYLRETNRKANKPYSNVRFGSQDYDIQGVCDHFHCDKDGGVIYEYSVDRVIRKTGAALPEPLNMLLDCEHHYYGLKLNCLALLSGQRIKGLVLQDMFNGETIAVRQNPNIARLFFSTLVPAIPQKEVARKSQFALFSK